MDGDEDLDQGIKNDDYQVTLTTTAATSGMRYDATNIVPTNDSGVTYSSTPGQVHNIGYLTNKFVGPSIDPIPEYAFFPMGTDIAADESLEDSSDASRSSM